MLRNFTLEYWIDDGWYVGKLMEVPDIFSQGKTLEKLEENVLFEFLPYQVLPGNASLLWLFLLEDFLLRLSEIATQEIKSKMPILLPWINEIESVKLFQSNK